MTSPTVSSTLGSLGLALTLTLTGAGPVSAQLLGGGLADALAPVTDLVAPVESTLNEVLAPVDPVVSEVMAAAAPAFNAVNEVIAPIAGPDAPLNTVATVSVGGGGDVNVTVLGGEIPVTVDPGSLLDINLPTVTVQLPSQPSLPSLPDLPDVVIGGPNPPPDVIINNPPNQVINNPPGTIINNPPGISYNPTIVVGATPNPGTPVVTPGSVTIIEAPKRTTLFGNTGRNTSSTTLNAPRSSRLQMLMAILQNRGWLRFVAGNGICLPPFAVTQVREMLNRRETRQLDQVLAAYANDIMTMRTMLANCRKGPRLQANDINRVIGVGLSQSGTPVLYVL